MITVPPTNNAIAQTANTPLRANSFHSPPNIKVTPMAANAIIAISTATGPLSEFCNVCNGASQGRPVCPVPANNGVVRDNITVNPNGMHRHSFLIRTSSSPWNHLRPKEKTSQPDAFRAQLLHRLATRAESLCTAVRVHQHQAAKPKRQPVPQV